MKLFFDETLPINVGAKIATGDSAVWSRSFEKVFQQAGHYEVQQESIQKVEAHFEGNRSLWCFLDFGIYKVTNPVVGSVYL